MARSGFTWLVLKELLKLGTALMWGFRRRVRGRNKKEKVVLEDGKLSVWGNPGESLYIC